MPGHGTVAALREQIEEVASALALLQRFIAIDTRKQLAVQQRGQLRVGLQLKRRQRHDQGIAGGQAFREVVVAAPTGEEHTVGSDPPGGRHSRRTRSSERGVG